MIMSINQTSDQHTAPSSSQPRLTVIGLGASAGGLTALRAFFSALPADTSLTFVVVVHLSPEHESMLASLLQPYTSMPVVQVTERVQMAADHIYVIPPAKQMVMLDGALDLISLEQAARAGGTRPMQIDAFFRSLAENHGDGGAVILSGSGSDGAVGIQAIKEKGGLILVQAPDEAEYDAMPRSAIATGLVDIVAPVAELATQLVAAKQMHTAIQLPADGETLSEAAQQTLNQILAQLRVRTGHDFSGYKQPTLLRRLARRMQLTQLTTLTAYLHRLRQDSAEAEALFRDLLINVTEFFRDREAWVALAATIIPQLFAGKGRDDSVRVWAVGCATGEEAYSIAMVLLEYASELVAPPSIQVFASDLGQAALDFAREGCYPEAIAADISEGRLARFFTKDNSHYRARPELREAILFTQHNLLQDPPFSRLDLIVCRNLLIYIQRELQEKVFETFYYALRPQGFLFLGNAESAEGATDLFDTLDKRQRIYQRHVRDSAIPILPSLPLLPHAVRLPTLNTEPVRPAQPHPNLEHQRLLEIVTPPSLLVDRDYNVLHLSETAGRYLLPPGGVPTVDVLRLVRPELQAELRAALFRAYEENKAVSTRPMPVRFNGASHLVYLMVRPHQPPGGPARALVIFLEDETPLTIESTGAGAETLTTGARQQLEAELHHVQNRLQSMREEYETTVEELRAANEELQSTNEEYKSTLEELETSKEELQSINEELQTINQELKTKVEEVTHAHSDVQNLFIATDIATLFLDRELRVKRYTPSAAELFNLMPPDKGRPISHLRSNLLYEQLESDAQRVLAHLAPIEREIQSQSGRWFLVRVRPYRTLEDRIDGVVITFIDITANKANELALRNAKEYAESIVHTIPDALLVLTPDLRIQMANDAFYEIFQVNRDLTEGRLIYELGNGQWQIPALRTLLEEILPENQVFIGYEVSHTFESIGQRTMLLNGRRLDHAQLILLAITDITERKRREANLAFLADVNAAFALLTTADEILNHTGEKLAHYLGLSRCDFSVVDEAADRITTIYDWRQYDTAPSVLGEHAISTFLTPLARQHYVAGKIAVVNDVRNDPKISAQPALMAALHIGAVVDAPYLENGRWQFLLSACRAEATVWRADEIELIGEVAARLYIRLLRANAEAALRHSEERLQCALEIETVGVAFFKRAGPITAANSAFLRMSGYTPEDLAQGLVRWDSQTPPEFMAVSRSAFAELETVGQTTPYEKQYIRKDGSLWWGLFTAKRLSAEESVKFVIDITERKATEAALQHLNATLEQEIDTRTAQVRTLASSLTMAEQEERRRISQILHDNLQQLLYGIQMRMMAIMTDIQQDNYTMTPTYAQEAYTWLGDAIQTTRQLTVDLSPPVLKDEGLVEALQWLVTQLAAVNNLQVTLQVEHPCRIDDEDMRVLLFQIVRELLFNVLKHAGVNQATVLLTKDAEHCVITVSDGGQGFDVAAAANRPEKGFGLFSVHERLKLFGGGMDIQSTPGQGTQITIYAPLTKT